ncbi:MFS transporter [Aeromicrobium sp. CF4.19]|uniref:MFS transporter n=1 Tax=Aeromicrobium sp. CF4.19 TaxID=3373082 RepID=UPI003EE75B97
MDAFDVYLAGGVVAAMIDEGFATVDSSAVFMSATFFGMMLGAAAGGLIGDRFGRKATYQINLLLFGLASIAAFFAPNIETLTVLRFIMGLGLGAELVVAMGMIGEFVPPGKRGRFAAMLSTIIAAGLPAASFVGLWVIPTFGWRYMFAIAGVAALLIWVARARMPESPRWLESQGRLDEADAIVARIEESAVAAHGTLPPVKATPQPAVAPAELRDLIRPGVRQRLFLAILLLVTINVTVYGFISWLPTLLVERGMTVTGSLLFTAMISAGAILGSLVCVFLADKISRTSGLALASGATVALGVVYALAQSDAMVLAVGLLLVSSVYFLVALGQFGYTPELFPTALRLRGSGLASMCGRAAAIGMPFVTVWVMGWVGPVGVVGIVVVLNALLVVSILSVRLETTGRSLEDIQSGVITKTESTSPARRRA